MRRQTIVSFARNLFSFQARRYGILSIVLSLILIAGCSSGGDDGGGATPPPPPPPAPPPATTADVTLKVVDASGSPVEGSDVIVVGSALGGTTDAAGQSTITIPYTNLLLLRATADGYADKLQVANVPTGSSELDIVLTMIARAPAETIAGIEAGGTATGRDGVKVIFPAGALVDSTGQPVTGDVQMYMTPVDVTGPDESAFPGAFLGVDSGGSDQLLLSHGVAEFVVQQGDETLSIAAGQTATVEVPLYADGNPDGSAVMVGDLIPFWSLNETTGVWLEETLGEVVASNDSPTGLAVRATVSHFSWWNIDVPGQRHTVNLTVVGPTACIPAGSMATIGAKVGRNAPAPNTPVPPASRAYVSYYIPAQLCTAGVTRSFPIPAGINILVDVTVRIDDAYYSGTITVGGPAGEISNATLVLSLVTEPQPVITMPANGSTFLAGDPVSITVEVAGPAPDRVEIRAGTTLLLEVDAAQPFYRVDWETTNADAGDTSISAVAFLGGTGYSATPADIRIEEAPTMPVITTDVQDVTVLEGGTATFSVAATGGLLQYAWQLSVDGGATFFPVDIGQPTLTFEPVQAIANGHLVRVTVSNIIGSVTSRTALLTVNVAPQATVTPAQVNAVAGQNAMFTAATTGTAPLAYQWQRSNNAGATWANIAGASDNTYTLATVLSDNGAQFRVQASNAFGNATSNAASLVVTAAPEPPVITQHPQNATRDAGETANFTVAATGTAPLSYQWQRFDVVAGAFANITGATSASYSLTAGLDDNGARIRAVVSNAEGSATSNEAILAVNFFLAPEGPRIAAASNTIARRGDGTVWVWGSIPGASSGVWVEQTTPLQVQPFNDARAVAAGGNFQFPFFYVLRQDGSVWSWGSNNSGQLGDGTQTYRTVPQPIPGLTRVIAIANTQYTGYALREDGTVWTWGAAGQGALGNGETQGNQLTPQPIAGLANIAAIDGSGGDSMRIALALRNDGVLYGWGQGSNLTLNYVWPAAGGLRSTPAQIPEAGVVLEARAGRTAIAILTDAERLLSAWGANPNGVLGIGTYQSGAASSQPTPVAGNLEPWAGFDLCVQASVGWTEAGIGYAWGQNSVYGVVGDPAVGSRTHTPNPVPGMDQIVEMVCGSENHAVAVKANGEIWAWGNNNRGQVGDGTEEIRTSPVLVPGLNLNTGL